MDYAQARIQARFGERPDESTWQAIRSTQGPAALLEVARSCRIRLELSPEASGSDAKVMAALPVPGARRAFRQRVTRMDVLLQ